jgi:hypothetical protein
MFVVVQQPPVHYGSSRPYNDGVRILQRVFAAALLAACFVNALADGKSATEIMNAAQAKAKAEKKNVLVMFDASW